MAWNPFIGWSKNDLETELVAAQIDLAQGKTVTSAGDGSVLVKNQLSSRPEVRIELLLRALHKIDPIGYPLDEISRTTEARIIFGTPNPPNPP